MNTSKVSFRLVRNYFCRSRIGISTTYRLPSGYTFINEMARKQFTRQQNSKTDKLTVSMNNNLPFSSFAVLNVELTETIGIYDKAVSDVVDFKC